MKRITILVVLIGILGIPVSTSAAIFKGGDHVDTGAQTSINDDIYIAGGTINSNSTIQGDLIAAGGNVTILGSTTQDVIAAAGTLIITGNVGDDLRAAGGTITVSGKVSDDAILAGGQVTLTSGSSVDGDAVITGGVVTIHGAINGNVEVSTEKLILGPTAVITGNLVYSSYEAAEIQSGAQILGETQFTQTQKDTKSFFNGTAIVLKLLSLFIIALLIQWLFKPQSLIVAADTQRTVMKNLGWGFVGVIIIPIITILLFVTVIGIPLGLIALCLYVILLLTAGLLVPVIVGAWVMKYYRKSEVLILDWKSALVGTFIVVIIGIIPILGGIINAILFLIVLGTLVKKVLNVVR